MAALKTYCFSDGIDTFYIAETSQQRAYEAFCKVGDSRISFYHFRSKLYTRWGNRFTGAKPTFGTGTVWTERPTWSGIFKREL